MFNKLSKSKSKSKLALWLEFKMILFCLGRIYSEERDREMDIWIRYDFSFYISSLDKLNQIAHVVFTIPDSSCRLHHTGVFQLKYN